MFCFLHCGVHILICKYWIIQRINCSDWHDSCHKAMNLIWHASQRKMSSLGVLHKQPINHKLKHRRICSRFGPAEDDWFRSLSKLTAREDSDPKRRRCFQFLNGTNRGRSCCVFYSRIAPEILRPRSDYHKCIRLWACLGERALLLLYWKVRKTFTMGRAYYFSKHTPRSAQTLCFECQYQRGVYKSLIALE